MQSINISIVNLRKNNDRVDQSSGMLVFSSIRSNEYWSNATFVNIEQYGLIYAYRIDCASRKRRKRTNAIYTCGILGPQQYRVIYCDLPFLHIFIVVVVENTIAKYPRAASWICRN